MHTKRGFTLIEIMMVLVIMGVLAALALAKYNITAHRSHEKEADVALGQLYRMQEIHRNEYGAYATSPAQLARVGYVTTPLKHYTPTGSVSIPQCLTSTGRWNNRGLTASGTIENC